MRNLDKAQGSDDLTKRQRSERRREMRHTLPLPVRVAGTDATQGQWTEMAETVNVSSGGVALRLSRKVLIGDVLYLQIPIPARFQDAVEPTASLNVYARVRCVELHGRQQVVRLQYVQKVTRRTLEVSARY
jgi:hypothetical protein